MREVAYRGGVVTFRVPDDWLEEHGRDGGGTYYASTPGSGTLRLNVITLQPPAPPQVEHLLEAVGTGAAPEDPPPEVLPNGNALRVFSRDDVEDGSPVKVLNWTLASAAPPTTVRLALFSFTTSPANENEGIIKLLEAEVRAAQFTELTTEQVQARIAASRRPWWKVW